MHAIAWDGLTPPARRRSIRASRFPVDSRTTKTHDRNPDRLRSHQNMISGIYSNCMTDTSPVAQRLRDHLVVTFVHGGSGSDG